MDQIELFSTTPPSLRAHPPVTVRVPDRYRAELYRPELERARLSFTAYAARHAKVRAALDAASLVEGLAVLLDDYAAPAVIADVNAFEKSWFPGENITPALYRQYVAACLQRTADPYRASADFAVGALRSPDEPWLGLVAFFRRYPQARWMVDVAAAQYQENVLRCCDRVLDDWPDLEAYFFANALTELTAIKTTGSDFHKGGGQVLILTFRDALNADQKLVYKPTDVERDLRIVGDTVSLTAALGNPPTLTVVTRKGVTAANLLNNQGGNQGRSLAEMVTNLGGGLQPPVAIPTYKVLPVYPGTSLAVANDRVDVRKSYGYLAFLSNGPADNRLTAPQAQTYYQTLGAEVAVCYVFQVTDLHQENLIVHALQPCLIDLEMAYTGIMALPTNTNLSAAYNRFAVASTQRVVQGWGQASLYYGLTATEEPTQNRLYAADGSPRPLVADDNTQLRNGFGRTLRLIVQNQGAFDTWLVAAQGVVTRVLPFGTDLLLGQLRSFNDAGERNAVVFPQEIVLRCQRNGQIEVNGWGDELYTLVTTNNINTAAGLNPLYNGVAPKYAFWLNPQTADDFVHGDVPAYYQKMSTGQALGSTGAFVSVPFGLGIERTAAANQQALATAILAIWGTAPLYPSQYFTGPVFQIQRGYLQLLQNNQPTYQARLDASLNDLLRWKPA